MSEARALIAALAEETFGIAGDRPGSDIEHPDIEELLAYLDDGLEPEAETRVGDHLVQCQACTTRLLDLETLTASEPAGEAASDFEVRAAHRELMGRLRTRPRAKGRWLAAVAATLFLSTSGLSLWVAQLRSAVAELEAPVANPRAVYFDLDERSGTSEDLHLDRGHRRFEVAITPRASQRFDTYRVAIQALDDGRSVVLVPGLVRTAGVIRFEVSTRQIPPGAYRLVLFGLDLDAEEELARLQLRVLAP